MRDLIASWLMARDFRRRQHAVRDILAVAECAAEVAIRETWIDGDDEVSRRAADKAFRDSYRAHRETLGHDAEAQLASPEARCLAFALFDCAWQDAARRYSLRLYSADGRGSNIRAVFAADYGLDIG